MVVTPGFGSPFSPASQTSCTNSSIGIWRGAAAAQVAARRHAAVSAWTRPEGTVRNSEEGLPDERMTRRTSVQVHDAALQGGGDRLAAARDLELSEDALDVHPRRLLGDPEGGHDGGGVVAPGEELKHLPLARGERRA